MKRTIRLGLATLIVGAAYASASTAAAETYYSSSGLKKLLSGKTVRLQMGGVVTYSRSGKYTYRRSGETWRGTWSVSRGKVCVKFVNNERRCDRYVKDGSTTYFENAGGGRFKIRSIR